MAAKPTPLLFGDLTVNFVYFLLFFHIYKSTFELTWNKTYIHTYIDRVRLKHQTLNC